MDVLHTLVCLFHLLVLCPHRALPQCCEVNDVQLQDALLKDTYVDLLHLSYILMCFLSCPSVEPAKPRKVIIMKGLGWTWPPLVLLLGITMPQYELLVSKRLFLTESQPHVMYLHPLAWLWKQ